MHGSRSKRQVFIFENFNDGILYLYCHRHHSWGAGTAAEPLCGLNLLTYSAECYTEVKRLPDKPTNQVYQYCRIFKQQKYVFLVNQHYDFLQLGATNSVLRPSRGWQPITLKYSWNIKKGKRKEWYDMGGWQCCLTCQLVFFQSAPNNFFLFLKDQP